MNAHANRHLGRSSKLESLREEKANPTRRQPQFRWIGKAKSYALILMSAVIYFTAVSLTSAQAAGRVALLIGAEKYQHFKASTITVEQTTALEQALKAQGFDVTTSANPGNAAARAALSDFSRKAEAADFALIVVAGHFATYRKQSFFLPTNTRVRRATDLFSRGLSAANLADIANRAKSGALLMFVTVPDIPSTIAGVGARPDFASAPPPKIVSVFSSSTKVPVSRVDDVSLQAMKDLIEAAGEKPMMLAALVNGAAAGGTGRVFGSVKELNLSEDMADQAAQKAAEAEAQREAERKARLLAETRLSAAEERARKAELRAKEIEKRALENAAREKETKEWAKRQLDAAAAATAKREAEARKAAIAEAERAAEAKEAAEEQARRAAEANAKTAAVAQKPATPTAAPQTSIQSLQVVEALLGRGQRRAIQRLLRAKGLYRGPIDAVFGDQTREAIRAFQKQSGAEATGYLTPEQFQSLIASR